MSRMGVGQERPPARPEGPRGSGPLFLLLAVAATSILLAASAVGILSSTDGPEAPSQGVQVFYNEACGDCTSYLRQVLLPALEGAGYRDVELKDYINVPDHRAELNALNDAFEVPLGLRSHLAAFVINGGALILQGHIPRELLSEALEMHSHGMAEVLLVYQDSMDEATTYRVWAPPLEVAEYDITVPLDRYFQEAPGVPVTQDEVAFIVLVVASGLVDGLNPCAIAILLFFISFLYVARRPRAEVLRIGTLYIYAIYVVYFLIGLGLMQAIILTGEEHLLALVGAYLVILLGLLTMGGLYLKPLGAITKTPHLLWRRVKPRLMRATLPSAFAGGLLVGLCTFPCSGGIYVAILGLLSTRTSYLSGLGYLYLYNLMFVLPLIAILVAVGNRSVARRLAAWESTHRQQSRLLSAALMIAIGVVILLFFV